MIVRCSLALPLPFIDRPLLVKFNVFAFRKVLFLPLWIKCENFPFKLRKSFSEYLSKLPLDGLKKGFCFTQSSSNHSIEKKTKDWPPLFINLIRNLKYHYFVWHEWYLPTKILYPWLQYTAFAWAISPFQCGLLISSGDNTQEHWKSIWKKIVENIKSE